MREGDEKLVQQNCGLSRIRRKWNGCGLIRDMSWGREKQQIGRNGGNAEICETQIATN